MNLNDVDAVLVTRGNVDLKPVLDSLSGFREVIIWDNSKEKDLKVYGRYVGAFLRAKTDLVYVQDDDCIVSNHQTILDAWKPDHIAANMPYTHRGNYDDGICLVGFGAVFDTELIPLTFSQYQKIFKGYDDLLYRQCDRVFTALNKKILVDVPYKNLPQAEAPDRMYKQSNHIPELIQIRKRISEILGRTETRQTV